MPQRWSRPIVLSSVGQLGEWNSWHDQIKEYDSDFYHKVLKWGFVKEGETEEDEKKIIESFQNLRIVDIAVPSVFLKDAIEGRLPEYPPGYYDFDYFTDVDPFPRPIYYTFFPEHEPWPGERPILVYNLFAWWPYPIDLSEHRKAFRLMEPLPVWTPTEQALRLSSFNVPEWWYEVPWP